MKGFKVFDHDWKCRGFQYEVGNTYEIDGEIEMCKNGFHFCTKASDCFNYYSFDSDNKVAEILAVGEIKTEGDKSVTNKIQIVKEINWQELLTIVNEGKNNTGNRNTGNRNTGNRNTGDWNTGNWNTGNRNTGNWNTGHRNTGHWNTGDWNTGNCNTGDWNITNNSSGVFCAEEQKILIFDKQSNLTLRQWRETKAFYLLSRLTTSIWIESSRMTTKEKEEHPEHETTGGFLKKINMSKASNKWWESLSQKEKTIIKSIPNFDADKFYKITGLRV